MLKTSLLLKLAFVAVLTACSAPNPGKYAGQARTQIDPLPADLRLTEKEKLLCQMLLLKFSATRQQLQASCGSSSVLDTISKPVEQ